MERENILLIATIVCIVGVVFMFKELNKAKNDVEKLKEFSAHMIHQMTKPEVVPTKQDVIEEDKTEENVEE